ncbi:alpha/beta fold hydrolase [Leptospira gomenensis]|uniref:Alpha/beta fold hydrolase n=1 Tax=Leptospira gomenensis TaxID=2484974 RepID=A0A5F1Y919_9LEPT|nr:alpha/beta fold hydrolase [Leptospira gomenensis]TGK32387.1 alpha/beta fold hydrolase [Leptospira gomenensis]TGK43969.1 alpha/beta fold hydrolase [Leptospira gomenensis]TGK48954.1 alpha/beta fold hydrolase [Leptospira gomenensis]TGK54665.1 alpha/beta fold hydrolase [Leptospira gomenensis]
MNDHLAYVSENRSVRNPLLQFIAEKWYTIVYLWHSVLGIFTQLEDSPEGEKRPVVLVPGFLGRTLSWESMRKHLSANGHPVYVVPLGFQVGNIRTKSKLLENFLIEKGIKDCYIVGHSMGGLISAGLTYKGRDRVKKLFIAGTPVHGTYLAYLAPFLISAWQMRPGSSFIREIVQVFEKLPNVQSVYTKKDQIILPSEHSRLGHFDDVELPEAGHLNLFMGPLGIECLADLITAEENKDPKPIVKKEDSVVKKEPIVSKSKPSASSQKKGSSGVSKSKSSASIKNVSSRKTAASSSKRQASASRSAQKKSAPIPKKKKRS